MEKELFKSTSVENRKRIENLMIIFARKIKKEGTLLESKIVGADLRTGLWGSIVQKWYWKHKVYKLVYEDNMDARDRARVLTKIYRVEENDRKNNESK